MRWKNIAKTTPEVGALEQRVDAMMDPSQPDPAPKTESPKANDSIDIFGDPAAKSKLPSSWLEDVNKTTTPDVEPVESIEIDDIATDRAVEAIALEESKADPLTAAGKRDFSAPKRPVEKQNRLRFLKNKKVWIPMLVIFIAFFAIPFTRYMLLGLFIKQPYAITVKDSKTSVAVSGAKVTIGGVSSETDGSGKAVVRAGVGSRSVTVSKANFANTTSKVFIGFTGERASTIELNATGRSVPVKVVNSITGKPVVSATINIGKVTAKTDIKGLATIVLGVGSGTKKATISSEGYNDQTVNLEVGTELQTLKITPVGKIYFLSNKGGKIDVVKSDLDGSNRQTVLAGTGSEEASSTSLIASRDWQYLALKSKRDNNQAGLYIIDTATDKATQFESASNTVNLIGWYGHNVIYEVVKKSTTEWQSGRQAIKSYNAETSQLNLLDQNTAEGTSSSYASESFSNIRIVDNAIVYAVQWVASGGFDLATKNASIRGMQPNGSAKKDNQTFSQSTISAMKSVVYAPGEIYFSVTATADNKPSYYQYQSASVSLNNTLDEAGFTKSYPTYLVSPSGTQTAWAEDAGNGNFFIGDGSGQRSKQVGKLKGYTPFGWFGETYIIVTRGAGSLYIFSPTDKESVRKPLRVTDYFKPSQSYAGNGYSYGGF